MKTIKSNLIEINPKNPSIKSLSVCGVRFTAFEESKTYRIRFCAVDSFIHCSQESIVSPCKAVHRVESFSDSQSVVISFDGGIDISIDEGYMPFYLALCELFSMSPNDDVVRAFQSRDRF